MSMKNETVKARIDHDLKKSVEEKLKRLGLTSSEVIRMLYAQIELYNKLPFELRIPHVPNKVTRDTIDKAKNGKEINRVEGIDQLKKELDIGC